MGHPVTPVTAWLTQLFTAFFQTTDAIINTKVTGHHSQNFSDSAAGTKILIDHLWASHRLCGTVLYGYDQSYLGMCEIANRAFYGWSILSSFLSNKLVQNIFVNMKAMLL